MEFEFTAAVYVCNDDLDEMANRVKAGETFDDAFDYVIMKYDDDDYYNMGYVRDKVKAEIERRIKK